MSKEIAAKVKELIISARTVEEMRINEFATELSKVDKEEVFGSYILPEEISLRAFCPECYKDNPNRAVYDKEYSKMCEVIDEINKRIMEYNRQVQECLQTFQN